MPGSHQVGACLFFMSELLLITVKTLPANAGSLQHQKLLQWNIWEVLTAGGQINTLYFWVSQREAERAYEGLNRVKTAC